MIKLIGVDLDDTLVQTADCWWRARDEFIALLQNHGATAPYKEIFENFEATERRNMGLYDFCSARFFISMCQVAPLYVPKIDADLIGEFLKIQNHLVSIERELYPDTIQFLNDLALLEKDVVLVTQGGHAHQQTKIDSLISRLPHLWAPECHIVQKKSALDYRRIFASHCIAPNEFLMIGDSLRSDIDPVLNLGGYAIHVPRVSTGKWSETQAACKGHFEIAASLSDAVPAARKIIAAAAPAGEVIEATSHWGFAL